MMASLTLSNDGERILCVLVEPYGEDFWIAPRQGLTFVVPDERTTASWYEGGVSVWVNEGDPSDVVVTTNAGEAVTCGYQRPAGASATSSQP
jgi:hypothetical protein